MQEQFIIRGFYRCPVSTQAVFSVVFFRLVVDFVPTLGL